jgi:U1 small nuclear ribonucleoprotein
MLILILDAV